MGRGHESMRKLTRGYLKEDESNALMSIFALMQMLQGIRALDGRPPKMFIWEVWSERGMMTAEARKYLKTAYTYLSKFKAEMMANLDEQTVNTLEKKLEKFDYRMVDDLILQKIQRDIHNHLKYAVMERKSFEDIMQEVAQVNCVGCTKDYKNCPLAKVFDEVLTIGADEQPNCPYACDLSKFTPKGRENYEKLKQRLRENNQFIKECGR